MMGVAGGSGRRLMAGVRAMARVAACRSGVVMAGIACRRTCDRGPVRFAALARRKGRHGRHLAHQPRRDPRPDASSDAAHEATLPRDAGADKTPASDPAPGTTPLPTLRTPTQVARSCRTMCTEPVSSAATGAGDPADVSP